MELDKKYQIIYADQPWAYHFQKRKGLSDKAKSKLYPTMNGNDIVNIPIKNIVDKDCILFLWIMNSEIPLALNVIENWGFKYKTVAFTWVKTTKNTYHFGGGNWTRSNPELCLLATKGNIKRKSASVRNLIISPLKEHSKKPDEIREMIVKLVGDLPRIELFARKPDTLIENPSWKGWDTWGNECKNDIELKAN